MSAEKIDEQKPVPYPAQLMMYFTLQDPSSDDVKLITILEHAIERFDHLPADRLRAVLDWFNGYAESRIREIEIGAKAPK